ncbi:MAG: endonuclease/exonuclease/phosphatase family protein [Pirellulales bacterium]
MSELDSAIMLPHKDAFQRWLGLAVSVLAVCASLATLLGFLASWSFLFEYCCHFRVQYGCVLAICAMMTVLVRHYWSSLIYATLALVNMALVLPLCFATSVASFSGYGIENVRLAILNVEADNTEYERVIAFLHETNAELVALVEINREWMVALEPILGEYPYATGAALDTENGVLILARYPIIDTEVKSIYGRSAVVAHCDAHGSPLTIIAAHTVPPKTRGMLEDRNRQLAALAETAKLTEGAVLLVGDLNTSSWSPRFQDLVHRSQLRDSRIGFGVQSTWPVGNCLLRIPIDHCLVSRSIVVQDRKVGPDVGSDHFPVIIDMSIQDGRLATQDEENVAGSMQPLATTIGNSTN